MSTERGAALSPLDGRYRHLVEELAEAFSEAALNRARVHVEVEWIVALTAHRVAGTNPLDPTTVQALRKRVSEFGPHDVATLAALEATTQHDVKAVEYFVRQVLTDLGLSHLHELAHFGCTSEDINNLSYALLLRDSVQGVWLTDAIALRDTLVTLARAWRDLPMLSRTHGQPATPTTMGKEIAVFAHRLTRTLERIRSLRLPGKINGATGTFSAHVVAAPDTDWPALSRSFVEGLGLEWNPLTTQIESHDGTVELLEAVAHTGRILHNLATDIWTYISLGYLRQIPQAGTTGSSTMPHKINPIRFENAEANLEISGALCGVLAQTLSTTRLQRDLTDSSSQRNIGLAIGHSLVAIKNITRGLSEVAIDEERLRDDLDTNWEVLGEAIQTVIRAEIISGNSSLTDPYDVVKKLTRGERVTASRLHEFIQELDISDTSKARLLALRPHDYVGLASELVEHLTTD